MRKHGLALIFMVLVLLVTFCYFKSSVVTTGNRAVIYLLSGENSDWHLEKTYIVLSDNKMFFCGGNLNYIGTKEEDIKDLNVVVSLVDNYNTHYLSTFCHSDFSIKNNNDIELGSSIINIDDSINVSESNIEIILKSNVDDSIILKIKPIKLLAQKIS